MIDWLLCVQAMQAARKLPPLDADTLSVDVNAMEESTFSMGKHWLTDLIDRLIGWLVEDLLIFFMIC